MAALTITANQVRWISGNRPVPGKAAGALSIGRAVYLNASGLYALADANAAVSATGAGIVITAAGAANQDILVAPHGATIDIGATTALGVPYVISSTDAATANDAAGDIAPYGDLGAGDIPCFLFWGTGDREVTINIAPAPGAIA